MSFNVLIQRYGVIWKQTALQCPHVSSVASGKVEQCEFVQRPSHFLPQELSAPFRALLVLVFGAPSGRSLKEERIIITWT